MIIIKEAIASNLQLSPTEGASRRKPSQKCEGFFISWVELELNIIRPENHFILE